MTNTVKAVTVYDIQIIDGKPVRTPHTFDFDESKYVRPDDGIELFSSNELQQEAGRLNRSFNRGYFGH